MGIQAIRDFNNEGRLWEDVHDKPTSVLKMVRRRGCVPVCRWRCISGTDSGHICLCVHTCVYVCVRALPGNCRLCHAELCCAVLRRIRSGQGWRAEGAISRDGFSGLGGTWKTVQPGHGHTSCHFSEVVVKLGWSVTESVFSLSVNQ